MDSRSAKKVLRDSYLQRISEGNPETIHKVSRETDDIVVLRAIAKNDQAAPLTLKLLSVINNKSLRVRIAMNKNTPYKTLKMLEELGYEIPGEVLDHAAKMELSLRKGIKEAEDMPGLLAQQILKTL